MLARMFRIPQLAGYKYAFAFYSSVIKNFFKNFSDFRFVLVNGGAIYVSVVGAGESIFHRARRKVRGGLPSAQAQGRHFGSHVESYLELICHTGYSFGWKSWCMPSPQSHCSSSCPKC